MEPTRLLPICCITLLLGACAVRQPPVRVLAEPPPQWYAPLPHNGQLTDLSRWWQSLGDPLLAQLVEAAQVLAGLLALAQTSTRLFRLMASPLAA